jgi:hypothetical protein
LLKRLVIDEQRRLSSRPQIAVARSTCADPLKTTILFMTTGAPMILDGRAAVRAVLASVPPRVSPRAIVDAWPSVRSGARGAVTIRRRTR